MVKVWKNSLRSLLASLLLKVSLFILKQRPCMATESTVFFLLFSLGERKGLTTCHVNCEKTCLFLLHWNTTSAEANSIKCAYEAHRLNHFHPFWAEVYDPSLDKLEALVELEPPTIISACCSTLGRRRLLLLLNICTMWLLGPGKL